MSPYRSGPDVGTLVGYALNAMARGFAAIAEGAVAEAAHDRVERVVAPSRRPLLDDDVIGVYVRAALKDPKARVSVVRHPLRTVTEIHLTSLGRRACVAVSDRDLIATHNWSDVVVNAVIKACDSIKTQEPCP